MIDRTQLQCDAHECCRLISEAIDMCEIIAGNPGQAKACEYARQLLLRARAEFQGIANLRAAGE